MGRLTAAMQALAMLALATLLAVVAGEIGLRLLSDLSGGAVPGVLPGGIELARYLLMIAVVSALPGAARTGFVRVELLAGRLPAALQGALARLWGLALGGVAGIAAWRFALAAAEACAAGEVTQVLALPVWPVTAWGAVALAVLALVGLGQAAGARA